MTVRQDIPIRNPLLVSKQFLSDLDAHLRSFDDILIDQYARKNGLAPKDVEQIIRIDSTDSEESDWRIRSLRNILIPKYSVSWENSISLDSQKLNYALEIMDNEISEINSVSVEYGEYGKTTITINLKSGWIKEKSILIKTDHQYLSRIKDSMTNFMRRYEPENSWLYRKITREYLIPFLSCCAGAFIALNLGSDPGFKEITKYSIALLFFMYFTLRFSVYFSKLFPDPTYQFGLHRNRSAKLTIIWAIIANVVLPAAIAIIFLIYGTQIIQLFSHH
ncbi:MAG: hypothetical protein P4N59_10060 [Negativicutes bacterium]|nr:hypothetical protein [Negativicutes bacterium]